jgi:hypothetical protein
MSEATETDPVPETEQPQVALNRVLNTSIFFVGVGLYAVAGYAMYQLGRFASLQQTYFAVGVVVGLVGLLLWLLTR